MPDSTQLDMWREKLATELHALDTSDDDSREDRGTVTLDQQSVGRLSRMDAMQRQAMAQATSRRRAQRRARILAALARLDEGEYGVCQDCGEDIPPGRLELDPTVATCVSCANG